MGKSKEKKGRKLEDGQSLDCEAMLCDLLPSIREVQERF
jgi:hypothetical protein